MTNVLKLAERGDYKKLIIEYPDRLARFGYSCIERHLRYCGVEIIAITEKEPRGREQRRQSKYQGKLA
ncbi:hypothetical protein SAMN02745133_02295 [Desulforamulus putei DSM 12395]|uniref:Resolvase, N terminal domain n=1 Tax=Desulforamulus putei DSM 12395 TaxID=1121429 RepID=A0A1M5AHK8_9FIRM|nr:hypothetical protein [Desulforamulus putei]SHF29800.1 hypothetical protein SAMN02745133_02295 [Desulforamulus putei DSM 12395]